MIKVCNSDVKLPPRGLPAVLSVDVNPMDNTQILVAFTNSVIVLFDANARKGTKCFSAPDGVCPSSFSYNTQTNSIFLDYMSHI